MKPREKTGGRVAGTPNKTTSQVKTLLTKALTELGGLDYIVQFGRDNPEGFLKLWVKLLPIQAQISGSVQAVLPVVTVSTSPPKVSPDATNSAKVPRNTGLYPQTDEE